MKPSLSGIHHVTAISGSAQTNLDFYSKVLGLRLVKKTVNFDDNHTYHLYYGDAVGSPGTAMTFFPWEHAQRGRNGPGLTQRTAYIIAPDAVPFWKNRLETHSIPVQQTSLFNTTILQFVDPDGLILELHAGTGGLVRPWQTPEINAALALRGFAGVTLASADLTATSAFLTYVMGYVSAGNEGGRHRFILENAPENGWVDVTESNEPAGKFGRGTVHHVAFRVDSDATQQEWLRFLFSRGIQATGVKDRQYFHSIYFREPGGVLFEIATETPGFLVDEEEATLGTALKLPSWVEPRRKELEAVLPKLHV